jgi:uncharacterized protein YbaR (Trm112 family)
VNLPETLAARLRCPRCGGTFADQFTCTACGASYPAVNGTPILIDEDRSVFRADEIAAAYQRERGKTTRGVLGRIAWFIASRT